MLTFSLSFFSFFILFITRATALSAQVETTSVEVGQTLDVSWSRTSKDPVNFFLCIRKDDGLPIPGTSVVSGGAPSGQVAIDVPSDLAAGSYILEAFTTSTPGPKDPPLTSSNSFQLTAATVVVTSSSSSSSILSKTSSTTHSSSRLSIVPLASATIRTEGASPTVSSSIPDDTSSPTGTFIPDLPLQTSSIPDDTGSPTGAFIPDLPLQTSDSTDPATFPLTTQLLGPYPTPQVPPPKGSASTRGKPQVAIIVGSIFGAVIFLCLLFLCFLVIPRRYRQKRRAGSTFYQDMLVRRRIAPNTPSFTTDHLPALNYDEQAVIINQLDEKYPTLPPPAYGYTYDMPGANHSSPYLPSVDTKYTLETQQPPVEVLYSTPFPRIITTPASPPRTALPPLPPSAAENQVPRTQLLVPRGPKIFGPNRLSTPRPAETGEKRAAEV
ncbi:hypothetical protein C8J56DRAFT_1163911 [Mycena floridula]|nr:hypothetical protein C8J56DRAFT_1163911 [Mycena floridula]